MSPTRRALLSGSATLAVAGLGATAGCLGMGGGDGTDQPTATDAPDRTETASPDRTETASPGTATEQIDAPVASFSFEYNASDGVVTVTVDAEGGDGIDPENLFVRGTDIDGSENGYPGSWNPDDTYEGQDRITAGASTTVGVASDAWEIEIVWETARTTSILAVRKGPGA